MNTARRLALVLRRENVRVWMLSAVIGGAAVALYAETLQGRGALLAGPRLPWWSLALLFFLAEAFPVHLYLRSETHSLSLSELGIVLGLFLATPGALVLGFVCGSLLALVLVRRQKPLKVVFNVAQFALSTCIAIVAFRGVLHLGNPHGPIGWAAAAAGAATFGVVSVLMVTTTISFIAGGPQLRELPRIALLALAGSLASASLAVAAVELVEADRRAVWLMLVPAIFWGVAFRAYGTQRRRHEHLEFLYETMRATQGAPEFRAAVRELLVAARTMLAAEHAEIVLLGPTLDEDALRSVISDASEMLMERETLSASTKRAIAAAAARDGALLLPRGRVPHVLDEALAERALRDGLLTALTREQRVFAFLLIGNRAGDVSTFDDDDRRLFETFAGHAAVLLENDQVKEQLRYQAYHDALTQLANRSLFAERVAESLALNAAGTTVLFIDLDDFKTINDTLGHSAGDELLAAVAERVRACVRPDDLAARLGGDEFGILVEHGSDEAAERIALRLVSALRAPFVLSGRETQVHASIGIASGSTDAHTADELLSNADVAMYSAKSAGKRRYAFYEPRMHTRVRRRHELAAALEHAIDRDEVTVHFQPIVTLTGGRTVACEALVRWQHPSRGLVLPGGFLSLAEERGLMVPIGRAVLREACARTREWQRKLPRHAGLGVNVNLSPSELQSAHLTRDVAAVLEETGLPPESLTLEITESGAMADPAAALETLRELRRLGVRLALDDFGTGYSSLSHLRDFPIDVLKLAKPFVDRLDAESEDTTFTDAILRLAAALQLTVVAEGIERAEQAEVLRRLECSLGQGYFFARPLDAADAERHLAETAPRGRRAHIRVA
jgi:diguanylate cyclase (GGDEF)-like protein